MSHPIRRVKKRCRQQLDRSPLASDLRTGFSIGRRDRHLMIAAVRSRRISRKAFAGWVAANPNRAWEYPWVVHQVKRRAHGLARRAVDFGAGKSPIPIELTRLGLDTHVVDPDSEPVVGRLGNEWDFVDYSSWGVTTHKAGMEEHLFDEGELGVAVSVSVIEHLTAQTRRRAIREVARVVASGGLVVFTVDVMPGESRQLWNRVAEEIEPLDVHGTVDDVIEEAASCGLALQLVERCPLPEYDSSVFGMVLTKDPRSPR